MEAAADSPTNFVDQLVVPGEVVLDLSKMSNQTIKLGGGLRQYVPSVGESVLGIVVDTKADNFLVDIKGPALAFLPVLAFEGGTRRNIPKFERLTVKALRHLQRLMVGAQCCPHK